MAADRDDVRLVGDDRADDGLRSAVGGNSELVVAQPGLLAPLAKPAAASFENGSLAPIIAADVGFGLAVSTMNLSALSGGKVDGGNDAEGELRLRGPVSGDSAGRRCRAPGTSAQIGFIAGCTPLV